MTVPDPAEIQRYAEGVLRRPEFHTALQQQRGPGWLAPVLEWLAMHRLPGLGSMSPGTLLLIVVAAALVAFLIPPLVRLFRSGAFHRTHTAHPGSTHRATVPAEHATARDSLRMARAALAAGDARVAIQALLRACLDHLADLGVIALERWKTNLVYLRECPPSLPCFAVFQDLASAHNDIVYAHRVTEATRIGAMMDALQEQIERR